MIPKGKPTAVTCDKVLIPEFPALKFAAAPNGVTYFDATDFLSVTHKQETEEQFFTAYKRQIESLAKMNDIPENAVCVFNQDGHILIEGHFVYLFISFVEPSFLAYVMDRINDLFTNGFAVSDTYVFTIARQRFSQETLNEMANVQSGT